MQRKRIIFAVVAIALLLAALAYYLTHRSTPLAYSGTIETREINIGSKIGGRVTNVFVEEGQQVPANTPTRHLRSRPISSPARPGASRRPPGRSRLQPPAARQPPARDRASRRHPPREQSPSRRSPQRLSPRRHPPGQGRPRAAQATPSTQPHLRPAWSRWQQRTSSPSSNSTATPPSATTPHS